MEKRTFYCQACASSDQHIAYVIEGFPILRCQNCGVGRVDVENFDPKMHYDGGYFTGSYKHSYRDYLGSKDAISREFANLVKFIRETGPKNGKLLEIGSAYGFFLQKAREYYDVYGVEIVAEAAEYCHKTGLSGVKHGVLETADVDLLDSIDVAVMLDVIEHIDNLEETFGLLASNLNPGGSMFVTTGDWSSIAAKITGKNWRLMAPPLHLWYFTPRSLTLLGKRFGLEVKSIVHPWKIVPLELIVQQACVTLGLNLNIALPRSLRSVGIPANMWDAMRVTFVKP